ncbi:unnamed protein product [Gongylonema pulchrum]|uniref:Uncharacterized protein n=1 Tax=Gongylonema pulchrum TaxID=637853 RepID=A0A183DW36_9BILA|nr:unnamed protein product [Gongylonema pulchrum]
MILPLQDQSMNIAFLGFAANDKCAANSCNFWALITLLHCISGLGMDAIDHRIMSMYITDDIPIWRNEDGLKRTAVMH